MIIGIDGTGPADSKIYEEENRNSHVSQVIRASRQVHKQYFRGPALLGGATRDLAEMVVRWVQAKLRLYPTEKIYLVGHSRGGAAVIWAAEMIQNAAPAAGVPDRILINGMFLFDAVNYTLPGCNYRADLRRLPTNVVRCFHAMRDPMAGSRSNWGNCGTIASIPNQIVSRKFFGSHAALGGTPGTGDLKPTIWKTHTLMPGETDDSREVGSLVTEAEDTYWKTIDPACANAAKTWMWKHLYERGALHSSVHGHPAENSRHSE